MHRHARLAGFDHRAAEDRRAADQSHRVRRDGGGRLPRGDPVAAGLRLLGQADRDRLGPRAHRAGLGRADAAPRLHPLRRPGRRLGLRSSRADGAPGTRRGCSASTPTCPAHRAGRSSRRRSRPAGRRRPALDADERPRTTSSTPSTRRVSATPSRWRTRPQTLVRDRGLAGRAGRLDARPRRGQLRPDRADLRRRSAVRRPHARRHPRQHHAVLADEHRVSRRRVSTGRASWCSSARRTCRLPVGRDRLPRRDLPRAASPGPSSAYPNLIYFNKADRGGHFAAWEQPELFSEEVRAAFRSLR